VCVLGKKGTEAAAPAASSSKFPRTARVAVDPLPHSGKDGLEFALHFGDEMAFDIGVDSVKIINTTNVV